ncbi:unnamed protein product [Hydatigera taeniaeformis]|uniref:Mediator of RNA polymerase II transcription subunit 25 n=1 Tax=Hydatigena taeniaeformis TaxID=6205 RepID=A0A0R3WSR4_HYDTA|nr:unnamed protein product [Hydatigera taeniaeformis]
MCCTVDLLDPLIECSILLITGALAPQRKGCEKLYEALMKVHSAKSCAIRELVVVENVANVLAERVSSVPNTLIPLLAASHSPHSSPPPPPPPTTTTTTKATTTATTTNTTAPDKVIESMQYFLQGIGLGESFLPPAFTPTSSSQPPIVAPKLCKRASS